MADHAGQRPDLVAVVTGAGSGVGRAVALALADRGVRVALVGRTAEKLARVEAEIAAAGRLAASFPCDVSAPAEVAALREAVLARFGPPLVLVNAAGLHCEGVPIAESTPAKWIETFSVNTIGPYLMCRAFMGDMLAAGWGRIINVSSAASIGAPGNIASVYQLSKVALNHFTRQLAVEVAGTGVTANALHPGEVRTEMWAAIKAEAESRTGPGRGMLKWAEWVEATGGDPPEKTADLVLELLSPAGDAVNGKFLWIKDGLQEPRAAW
jgi:NAD(P)-dependent dehydrogenase (short-subunit alcohol dehydrogenase family)